MSDCPISSVEELKKKVNEDYKSWDTGTYPWFRGEPKCRTPLLPKLYRQKKDGSFKYDENQLVQFFRMKAPALIQGTATIARGETDLWLFLMQHFRLPTRLLDWTEGVLIALYFALQEKRGNPVVWMLNPCKLNELAIKVRVGRLRKEQIIGDNIHLKDNEFGLTWIRGKGNTINIFSANINGAWSNDVEGVNFPVAIPATHINLRMSVQRSCFTVQGKWKKGLDICISKIDKKFGTNYMLKILRKYDIDGKNSEKMLKDLRMLGISATTVFPDLEGLSKELMAYFYTVAAEDSQIR